MFKLKHKISVWLFPLVVAGLLLSFLIVPSAHAIPVQCPDGTTQDAASADAADHACDAHQTAGSSGAADCTSKNSKDIGTSACAGDIVTNPCTGKDYCGFVNKYINPAINFLAVGFGLIVTIVIVASGIQYITSGGDPQGVNAARKRIFNAVLALLLFIFMYAILQWLIPGGLFG